MFCNFKFFSASCCWHLCVFSWVGPESVVFFWWLELWVDNSLKTKRWGWNNWEKHTHTSVHSVWNIKHVSLAVCHDLVSLISRCCQHTDLHIPAFRLLQLLMCVCMCMQIIVYLYFARVLGNRLPHLLHQSGLPLQLFSKCFCFSR